MKIWRALWQVSASMHYCTADEDPSLGIRRETPKGRSAIWTEGEVVRLVKAAWRNGLRGLACIIAVAYDAQLAPVDARALALEDSRTDSVALWFDLDRAKTGRSALGTLSRRTQTLVLAYVGSLPVDLHPAAPIFRTRRGVPYRKNSLAEGFREIGGVVFSNDTRQLQDMRRTGAVEAQAGALISASSHRRWRIPSRPRSTCKRPTCPSIGPRWSLPTRLGSVAVGAS